jgi:hypothetical protein
MNTKQFMLLYVAINEMFDKRVAELRKDLLGHSGDFAPREEEISHIRAEVNSYFKIAFEAVKWE